MNNSQDTNVHPCPNPGEQPPPYPVNVAASPYPQGYNTMPYSNINQGI